MASTDTTLYDLAQEFQAAAQCIKTFAAQPYATAGGDRWTVVFADFGHDLLVLGVLPTPDEQDVMDEDLFGFLFEQCLSSYAVTAADAAAAEGIARNHFKAERADAEPWADTWLTVMPGTVIPPQN